MNPLSMEDCVKVNKSTPALLPDEIRVLLEKVPGWQLIDRDGGPSLTKTFEFPNFIEALDFTLQVGRAAEDQDHHPAILTEWGRVTVAWWTHVVHGLHRNDFIMAARTDSIFETLRSEEHTSELQ